jgi:hypothetical protein
LAQTKAQCDVAIVIKFAMKMMFCMGTAR